MKKFVSTALAFVLTLGMSVTAFAAGSVSKTVSATTDSGVAVSVTTLDEATTNTAKTQAATLVGEKASVLEAVDVTLPQTVSAENPVTIAFTAPSVVSATTKVWALHQKHDGTWEKLAVTVKDGKAYVTFTSLSPVVFVAEAAAPADASPKTSDAGMITLVIALLAGASLVCVNKKFA